MRQIYTVQIIRSDQIRNSEEIPAHVFLMGETGRPVFLDLGKIVLGKRYGLIGVVLGIDGRSAPRKPVGSRLGQTKPETFSGSKRVFYFPEKRIRLGISRQ